MKQTSDLLEMDLAASGADWRPTPHGTFMAKVLAEHNLVHGKRVLELGAGVGIHTIIMLRQGAAELVAVEVGELHRRPDAGFHETHGIGHYGDSAPNCRRR